MLMPLFLQHFTNQLRLYLDGLEQSDWVTVVSHKFIVAAHAHSRWYPSVPAIGRFQATIENSPLQLRHYWFDSYIHGAAIQVPVRPFEMPIMPIRELSILARVTR